MDTDKKIAQDIDFRASTTSLTAQVSSSALRSQGYEDHILPPCKFQKLSVKQKLWARWALSDFAKGDKANENQLRLNLSKEICLAIANDLPIKNSNVKTFKEAADVIANIEFMVYLLLHEYRYPQQTISLAGLAKKLGVDKDQFHKNRFWRKIKDHFEVLIQACSDEIQTIYSQD